MRLSALWTDWSDIPLNFGDRNIFSSLEYSLSCEKMKEEGCKKSSLGLYQLIATEAA